MRPRPYLSWSSLNLFESSPQQWIDVYIHGKAIPINRGMAYGRKTADSLENDEMTGDIVLDMVLQGLPKFAIMDKEFRVDLGKGKNKVPLLCKPDSRTEDFSGLKEYKTGKTVWTQNKVDEFGQITFYVVGGYLMTGKIAEDIELIHIPTISALDEEIEATGEIKRYPTRRSMQQVLAMMVRMRRAWAQMEVVTERELL